MEIIYVLSRYMNSNKILCKETKLRANFAIKLALKKNIKTIITSGWAYRQDTSMPIGKVVGKFISDKIHNSNIKVFSDINSRDTVGDALFIKEKLVNLNCSKLIVVTSDYHVVRTKLIFESFLNHLTKIKVVGVTSDFKLNKKILLNEKNSIIAFKNTFKNIDFKNNKEVFEKLLKEHPFYNGDIYTKLKLQ